MVEQGEMTNDEFRMSLLHDDEWGAIRRGRRSEGGQSEGVKRLISTRPHKGQTQNIKIVI